MKPISLVLQPSYILTGLLMAMSLLSCISILFAPIPLFLQTILGVLIAFATAFFIGLEALLLLPQSWRRVEVSAKGELTLTKANGERLNVRVKSSSYIVSYLVILHVDGLKPTENTESINKVNLYTKNWLYRLVDVTLSSSSYVILLPDSISQHGFRQLRVWLRWWRHSQTENYAEAEF